MACQLLAPSGAGPGPASCVPGGRCRAGCCPLQLESRGGGAQGRGGGGVGDKGLLVGGSGGSGQQVVERRGSCLLGIQT